MAKHKFIIPKPRSKRMEGSGTIFLVFSDGWSGDRRVEIIRLDQSSDEVELDIPDGYEWIHDTRGCDVPLFSATVEYINSTGSRRESHDLMLHEVKLPAADKNRH